MPLSLDAQNAMVPGVLRAFDAADLSNQLWSSQTNCGDQIGSFAKYVPPVVANGKVYVPNFSNQLLVYGLRAAQPRSSGSLAASVTCNSNSVNLTAVGTSDWAKWPNYVHKASGGSQISNYAIVGSGSVQTYTNDPRTLSYSDGTPAASGSDRSGVYIAPRGSGFRVTAPADAAARTLYLYAGGFNSSGTLTVHLSDNSAPDYVSSLSGSGQYDALYTITYAAASAGQQLVVTWLQTSDSGNITLQGAALSGSGTTPPAPLAPTGVAASDGSSATSVTVTWTASANATSYTVYRSTTLGQTGTLIGATNTTSLTDSTVTPGTLYYYSVVATGAGGTSAPSAQDSGYAGTLPPGSSALAGTGVASSATVNLTTIGTSDWVKWPNYVHKAAGGAQIADYTMIGIGGVGAVNYGNDPRTLAWSDGTPTASGSDQAGVYVVGIGKGFQITAPAGTASRTLYVYVGGWNSGGRLVAHLSDNSVPDYIDASYSSSGQYDAVYTLTYRTALAGQQLVVKWTQAAGAGNVTLQGAALR
jgi:uncharacterized protein YndB with AHSA1/START domain